jgi:rfaE bifunctional protein kinase chain/domain/rfaE bifunctional protein nucleotidyltransferase chain/domain
MSFYPEYINHKVVDITNLAEKIIDERIDKKIVMCHGTFDIVHPGHIRHLLYAKEKGDILIASVTADKYLVKKKDGPFIPEELRARNLAAMEMVDYVIIDHNQKPLQTISLLKPDYFVKGFEYSTDNIHPSTREEIEVVEKYGGKVLFSPGDVVYSSTKLQTIKTPKIAYEKLLALMDSEKLDFDSIQNTILSFSGISVHVVGDTIVDKYNYCSVLGPTTKTPTFSIKRESSETFVGGAGIVAKHLKSLGAEVTFTTLLGDDDLRSFVEADLKDWQIECNFIIDDSRPITLKERFWASGYKMLQVDTVDNHVPNEIIQMDIAQKIKNTKTDAVVFSDFRHGIFNHQSIDIFTSNINGKTLKVADSQVSNRWGNILDFQNFDLIFPNEKEARFSMGDQDSGIRVLGTNLFNISKAKNLVLKLGEKGLMVFKESGFDLRDIFPLDSFAEEIVDGVGAGDAFMSAATLAYAYSSDILISAIIGNIAAALACEVSGNIPASIEQILEKLDRIKKETLIE